VLIRSLRAVADVVSDDVAVTAGAKCVSDAGEDLGESIGARVEFGDDDEIEAGLFGLPVVHVGVDRGDRGGEGVCGSEGPVTVRRLLRTPSAHHRT
jgi:hypothetical protein